MGKNFIDRYIKCIKRIGGEIIEKMKEKKFANILYGIWISNGVLAFNIPTPPLKLL